MEWLLEFMPALETIGYWSYWFLFAATFVESLAFVGVLWPGVLVVILAGAAASQGFLDLRTALWFAALGAIFGDLLSYYLGAHSKRFFSSGRRFLRTSYLEKGKAYFARHGGISVFIGRFTGPLRSIIPFVAGLMHMPLPHFLLWNITSAFLWAGLFLGIGYFFAETYEVLGAWASRAVALIILLVIVIFSCWFIIKRSRPMVRYAHEFLVATKISVSQSRWFQEFIYRYPLTARFLAARFSISFFSGLPLIILLVLAGFIVSTFAGLTEEVIASEPIVTFDQKLAEFLAENRHPQLTNAFLYVTFFGSTKFVSLLFVIWSLALIYWRQFSHFIGFIVTLAGNGLTVYILKLIIDRDRPLADIAHIIEETMAFPSGHAAMAMAAYGYLGYYFIRHNRRWSKRTNIFFVALTFVSLIGFSRLYIGVHFLSDVLGGFLVGALWLLIGIMVTEILQERSYRSHEK